MLRQKDGARVRNTFQTFFGHGKNANFVDRTKAVFDGPNESEAAVGVAFKVQNGVDHVLQNTRTSQCTFFGDVAHQDDGRTGGFGSSGQVCGTFSDLRHRTRGRGELV